MVWFSSALAQQSAGLIEAARAGNLANVNALLAKGADPNMRGPQAITPLLVAASMGNIPIAKALLAKGAQVNVKDSSDWQVSPLMVAALSGRVEMMKLLEVDLICLGNKFLHSFCRIIFCYEKKLSSLATAGF